MASTLIEWTDATWNPVTGCDKVSPGCAHCYAEVVAARFWATQYAPVEYEEYDPTICGPVKEMRLRRFTDVQCHEDRLDAPLRWKKPRLVFVNSMSDLFHEDVPDEFIDRVFAVMALAPRHTFQVLTKRPRRMLKWATLNSTGGHVFHVASTTGRPQSGVWPLPNVWLGVPVENQHFADERIPLLLQTPAAVRFISAEPLLGPIDLRHLAAREDWHVDALDTPDPSCCLHWVIVGGESGPQARPMNIAWARSIVQQCQAANVPVFMKQLGAKPTCDGCGDAAAVFGLRDRKGGDIAEWPEDLRVRQWPA